MEEYDIDLNKFLSDLTQIYPNLIRRYNTDPIVVDLDGMSLYQDTISFNDIEMGEVGMILSDKRQVLSRYERQVVIKENKDYNNGVPKAWDDEDII
jgi:hypothetical protein